MTSTRFVPLPQLLRRFWLGVVLLAALTVLSTVLLMRWYGDLYPYNNPIFIGSSFQTDFVLFGPRFLFHYGTAAFYAVPPPLPFTYPAPMALVYRFFYGYLHRPHVSFILASSGAYLIAAALFARALVKRYVRPAVAYAFAGTITVLSYPVVVQLFVANMEVVVWVVIALGVWAFVADRNGWAATCFGVAASLKLFPFIYFALLFSRKKYKEIAWGFLVFAGLTLISLELVGPDFMTAYRGINDGLRHFQEAYVFLFHYPESGMDHSLFAVIKVILYECNRLDLLRVVLRPYLLTVASLGTLLYFLRIRRLPMYNQVLAITVASVLLPPVSHDYTLLHLYAPFVILSLAMVARPLDAREHRFAAVLLVCFLLLFSAENYLIHHAIRVAGQVKAGILLFLFALAVTSPLDFQPYLRSRTTEAFPSSN